MHPQLTRRNFVWLGGLSAFGLHWSNGSPLRAKDVVNSVREPTPEHAVQPTARAKHCVLVWLDGGPSHLDGWDPKPDAPREVRGPFETISTNVTGVALSELLPETAKRMNRWCLIRSMTSPLGEHNFGTHYLLSGQRPTPALQYPSYGAVVAHSRPGSQDVVLPAHIAIPNFRVGGSNFTAEGYLAEAPGVFEVGGDPSRNDFRVQHMAPPAAITSIRQSRRQAYVRQLQRFSDERLSTESSSNQPFEQAFRLLASPDARQAFAIEQEPDSTRQRYGLRSIGQSCLLARRLIERGVPFVTVNHTGWDTHADMLTRLKEGYTGARVPVGLFPSLDQALGALTDDLISSGLWQETLIVVMGEFGRTPKVNPLGGRDHWPRAFSVLCGGAGVPGGCVIGASDSMGESPADRPVTPADLAATLYTLLGVSPHTVLRSADGRPVPLISDGSVIGELLG